MRRLSVITSLWLLTALGCGVGEAGLMSSSSGLELLPGERNDALRASSDKYGVRAELLAAFAYQQSRLESGLVIPSDSADTPVVAAQELAAQTSEPELQM